MEPRPVLRARTAALLFSRFIHFQRNMHYSIVQALTRALSVGSDAPDCRVR
jgi:hypothetical protein